MKTKKKNRKQASLVLFFAVWVCCALLIFAAVGAVTWLGSVCSLPEDAAVSLHARADGTISAQWTASSDADCYRVKVKDAASGKDLLCETVTQPQYTFPVAYADSILQITPMTHYYYGFIQAEKAGAGSIQTKCSISVPTITDFHWSTDSENASLNAQWDCKEPNAVFSLCLVTPSGETVELLQESEHSLEVRFGENGLLPLPGAEDAYLLELVSRAEWGNVTAYGGAVGTMQVSRSELCPGDLKLQVEELGQNRYSFQWQKTAGSRFRLELRSSGGSVQQLSFSADTPMTYTSEPLNPFETYTVSLTALGGFGRGEQEAAAYATAEIQTGASSLYATCWPNRDLDLLDSPGGAKIGTAEALKAYCIIGENDQWFQILTGPQSFGWIRSDLCMINLPEYCGELISYDITNSYSSLYAVHEYAIANVTGTVVKGYENIRLSSGKYLVPLLYPTACKLVQAAQDAREQGYRIKIYDSFRPGEATRSIYDSALLIMKNLLPRYTYKGRQWPNLNADPGEDDVLQYEDLVTGYGHTLANFLAPSGSYHNFGVAMDMTLESLETGEECAMQTDMHDLSIWSLQSKNNANANILKNIMKGNGFGAISSEWWHYQDNENYKTIKPRAMAKGVNAEGWVQDAGGVRYRDARGGFSTSCRSVIGGTEYSFDQNGYLQLN